MTKEKIINLINELQKYDNAKGYKLEYEEARKELIPTIEELISFSNERLDELHKLIRCPETWSSLFALEILREIRSEKSIQFLIDYIIKNEKEEYGDSCEDAMFALTSIGVPAIESLINEVKNQFEKNQFYIYLVGALTEIKSKEVYKFMRQIAEDYINNEEKYGEWFHIDIFISDFDKQGEKEILPLLKEIIKLERISKHEKIEIKGTIEIIEDPVAYEKKSKEEQERLKPLVEEYLKEKQSGGKKIDKKELEKRMLTPDDDLSIQFKCQNCHKKQNINPGIIKILGEKPEKFSFENEILCKFCFSNNIYPTVQGGMDIMFQAIGTFAGYKTGVVSTGSKVYAEDKLMHFKETYDYILNRIKQEPKNSELYLRAGNIARNFNKYNDAIKHYEKALELNPKLIASYVNLVGIYEFRHKYYGIEDAKTSAIFYLNEMTDIFRSGNFDILTLKNVGYLVQFMGEKSESLGVYLPELIKIPLPKRDNNYKIGRNDPCPCGSGKKYKRCCLDKMEK